MPKIKWENYGARAADYGNASKTTVFTAFCRLTSAHPENTLFGLTEEYRLPAHAAAKVPGRM